MEHSNHPEGNIARRESRMGQSRTPMHLVFQASIGIILGIGLASVINLSDAQLALTGVLISVAAWVVEHGVSFSHLSLRARGRIGLVLRLVALIGFTISVTTLLAMA